MTFALLHRAIREVPQYHDNPHRAMERRPARRRIPDKIKRHTERKSSSGTITLSL